MIDFTITDPQPEKPGHMHVADPAANADGAAAAAAAEAGEVSLYNSRFIIPPGGDTTFTPFGADTQGALGPAATHLLNRLASAAFPPIAVEENGRVGLLNNPSRVQLLRQMKAYLGTAIVRGSAEVVRRWALHCVPPQHLPTATRQALMTRRERMGDV